MDYLALKAGLGYSSLKVGDADAYTAITYRLGAKYYAMSKIPVTLDVTVASTEADEDPMWLGMEQVMLFSWVIMYQLSLVFVII